MATSPTHPDRPKIAITMGDPAGIGPELSARLLSTDPNKLDCTPVVFGDAWVIEAVADRLQLDLACTTIDDIAGISDCSSTSILVNVGELKQDGFQPGEISASTGRASFAYVSSAIDAARSNQVAGVTTGPINKQAWQLSGIDYPGHTELFAERFETSKFCMMMTAPSFSCSLVTTHIGYQEVPQAITMDRILEVIRLTESALTKILDRKPTLAVLGLNPHAGENGLFGDREEERLIQPAIEAARSVGIQLDDPMPPDTAFLARHRDRVDGYVCMYHDQGLIPFKALNFETGVNITLGLPSIRTSVDHGTALDIAWQGKADVSSLLAAVGLASKLAE